MRYALLVLALVFLGGLMALTVYDVTSNGVTPLDVVAVILIAFMSVALLGALISRPAEDEPSDP